MSLFPNLPPDPAPGTKLEQLVQWCSRLRADLLRLRLLPGANITITTDGAGNDVTVASTGGGGTGSGTVTNIATTLPITGGPITTTGTIGVNDFVASGASHARGTVPDPGAVAGTTKFLREDATWVVPGGASSPLTTKGDIWGYDTTNNRIPVGTDAYVLTADSTQPLGVKWAPSSAGSGALQSQEFTTPGANTFNVPGAVSLVWVSAIAAGGGGSTVSGAVGGGGGGSGEFCEGLPVKVTAGGTLSITIGAKGTGASGGAGSAAGNNGGNTVIGSFTLLGGSGAPNTNHSGAGGGPLGAASATTTSSMGSIESPVHFGGGSGGAGSSTNNASGFSGAPGPGNFTGAAGGSPASTQGGGGGGASSPWGLGGAGGNGGVAGSNAPGGSYGTGGGGAGGLTGSTNAGGNGMDGYCLVYWIG